MLIKLKNKDTLEFGCFKFKCCIGQNNIKKEKFEGDKATPKGIFSILYDQSNIIWKGKKAIGGLHTGDLKIKNQRKMHKIAKKIQNAISTFCFTNKAL